MSQYNVGQITASLVTSGPRSGVAGLFDKAAPVAAPREVDVSRTAIRTKRRKKESDGEKSQSHEEGRSNTLKRNFTTDNYHPAGEDEGFQEEEVITRKQRRLAIKAEKKQVREGESGDTKEKAACTVYVGNIAVQTTKKQLFKHFQKCGKVESVRFRGALSEDAKGSRREAAISRKLNEHLHSLHGYVCFSTPEEATEALSLSGSELQSHHLRVTQSESQQPNHTLSVFVGNLPFSCPEEQLWSHFSSCGDLEGVRVVRDRATGVGRGFGYVIFKERYSLAAALRLHESTFCGRKIRVMRSSANSSNHKKAKPKSQPGASSLNYVEKRLQRKAEVLTGFDKAVRKKEKDAKKQEKEKVGHVKFTEEERPVLSKVAKSTLTKLEKLQEKRKRNKAFKKKKIVRTN